MKKYILPLVATALVVGSCGNNNFKVTGNVEGGADTTKMVLESSNSGRWFVVDSVKTTGNGDFKIEEPAPQYADIYRLRCGEKSIYFPIDSLEHINIQTNIAAFDTDFELSGSDDAVTIMNIDKKAAELSALPYSEYTNKVEQWKRELANQILSNPSGIVAYYAINKYIGNEPIFNPINDFDFKIIGAVANAYNSFKQNDPRTAYLVNVLRQGQVSRRQVTASDTLVVSEAKIINIRLQDKNGVIQDLEELSKKGNVILLNFTVYSAEFSPVLNKVLADTYRKYKSKGLEIYQVGIESDEFSWRQSAVNLPWITVYEPKGTSSSILATYNVTEIPLAYIIDRKGELVERITDFTQIESIVAKYM